MVKAEAPSGHTEVPGGHLGNVSVAVGGAPGEPGGGGQGFEVAEINHEPTSLCSGIFGERLPLRYYLTGGMLLSGLFTSLFGLGYFWNIHVLWYFVLVQVRAFSGLHSGDPAAPGHGRSRPGLLYHTVGSPAHSQGSLAGSGSQPEVPGGACEARSLPWGPGVRGTSAGGCAHVCEGSGGHSVDSGGSPIPDAALLSPGASVPPLSLQIFNGLVQTTGWPAVVSCVGNWFGKGK